MDKSAKMDLKTEPLADSSSIFLEGRGDSFDSFKSSNSSSRVVNNPESPSDSQDSKPGNSTAPTSFHSSLVSSSVDSNNKNNCQIVDCSSSQGSGNSSQNDAQLGTSQDILPASQVSCSLDNPEQGAEVTSQKEEEKAADSTHNGSKEDLCDSNNVQNVQQNSDSPTPEQPTSEEQSIPAVKEQVEQPSSNSAEEPSNISCSVDAEKPSTSACNGGSGVTTRQRKRKKSSKVEEEKGSGDEKDSSNPMDADSCTTNGTQKATGEISSTQLDEPSSEEAASKKMKNDHSECSSSTSAKQNEQDSKPVKSPSSTSQDSTDTVRSSTESSSKKEARSCAECKASKGLKYQVLFQGRTRFLCSDNCFKAFREKQKLAPSVTEKCRQCKSDVKSPGYMTPSGDGSVCSEKCLKEEMRHQLERLQCNHCHKSETLSQRQHTLVWEGMVFCNEQCLGKFQQVMGATCTYCKSPVPSTSLGKYCVRFGMDVHQFCLGRCLDNFKKGLKVCSFCQLDINNNKSAFLAPVGDKGQFRDFCSQDCLASYEKINGLKQRKQNCSVCDVQTDNIVLVTHKNLEYRLCGDLCIASFRHKNKLTSSICDTCSSFFKPQKEKTSTFVPCPDLVKNLCSRNCMSLYVLNHRKIMPCNWCKVKKYNFDMVQTLSETGGQQLFCSLNCLALFKASVPASVSQMITCEQCSNTGPAQYHLTMSDASMRNFCSYPCVLAFQSKYSGQQQPSPATPVISSVRSLAQNNSPVIAAPSKIIREVLIKPNPPKILKNKSTLCKPIMQSKSSTCKPSISHKASQTDGAVNGILPIPVPIFMPVPVHMFNRAVPTPFPFPVPQPVPIFLPTTQRTQQQILAKIKELAEELSKGAAAEEAGKRKPEDTPEEEPEAKVPKLEVVEEEEEVDLMEHRDKMFQKLQSSYGVSTFQCWLKTKLGQVGDNCSDDLLALEPAELASYLHLFAKELRRPRTQEIYPADIIYYLCLGIQAHLTQHGRADKIFVDDPYRTFNVGLTEALRESTLKTEPKELLVREEMLWESMELGAHSPQVLLTTLLYFATKGFGCRSPPDHARLTFSTVLKRRHRGQLYLAYLLPLKDKAKRAVKEEPQMQVLPENPSDAMRCPVKFYEFYYSKCPEQARHPAGPFFLKPAPACTAESPVWFSCEPLGERDIEAMLTRLLLVRDAHVEPQLVSC